MKKLILLLLHLVFCFTSNAKDSTTYKENILGANFYYNHHNQYFISGFMLDANFEHVFNRYVGLQTSFGFNRAKVNLNNWKEDFINEVFQNKYPNLTASILVNIVGNFYCINTKTNKLKLGFGIEYRNITDVITAGLIDLSPNKQEPSAIFTQSSFEQFNDIGLSANISYQYFFKSGVGINSTFGYNHYFTNMSDKAKNGERVGGSSFLKLGMGIAYKL